MNAAAGGGTFLTLPALMMVGVPSVAANATGTVALLPGYVSSTWGFREELKKQQNLRLLPVSIVTLIGGAIGATLLIFTSDEIFQLVVPWLMLLATLGFAFGPMVQKRLSGGQTVSSTAMLAGFFAVSVYGGYFNGGLGIVLLAAMGLMGFINLNFMNGIKNLCSCILTAIAVVIYAAGGQVEWTYALIMVVATVAGGYVGAIIAQRIPDNVLRAAIILVGALTTIYFFAQII